VLAFEIGLAGLDPATHVFLEISFGKDVDARDKPGQARARGLFLDALGCETDTGPGSGPVPSG